MNDNPRTLQEVCALATREYDPQRLGALIEEMLELLTAAQKAQECEAREAKEANGAKDAKKSTQPAGEEQR